MRTRHTQHSLKAFPVYSSAFMSSNKVLIGGGGGASRSGIKNKLRLYTISDERSIKLEAEYELAIGEDAPMSMATNPEGNTVVCGINSAEEQLLKGENENCRVFSVQENKLTLLGSKGTLSKDDTQDYQKVTVLSQDSKLVAVAGAYDFVILSYPSLSPISLPIHTEKEIYDATFTDTAVIIVTTAKLLVYMLPEPDRTSPQKSKGKGKGKEKALKLLKSVDLPIVSGMPQGGAFRAGRFNPLTNALYTIINTTAPRTRSKTIPRQGFLCKWNAETWTVEKSRKVSDKALTCFDLSSDGKLIGYGSSDLTIGLLESATLAPLVSILKAHELPPTTIQFNPSSTLLLSGSADNTIRLVAIPANFGSSSWNTVLKLLVALLVIILAIGLESFRRNSGIAF